MLPHKPAETRMLRNLGYRVPSPILSQYDWRGTTPFEAQRVTAAMLVCEPRAFVLNGMGTGKTRSVLFAYDYLKTNFLARKMLVVAPLSTLQFTWQREAFDVMPNYNVGIVYGSKERRKRVLEDPSVDIFVINHDGIKVVADLLAARDDIDVVCLDEVAVFRNYRTKRAKQARELFSRKPYLWGLTGTPTPRAPTDAYGIIKLINPAAYTRAFRAFQDELMYQVTQFKWVPRKGAETKVFKYMQPSVRFTLKDCVDIPPIQYSDEQVSLKGKQKKAYDALVAHSRILIDENEVKAVNAGVLLNKLLQISCGCVYDSQKNVVMLDAQERLAQVLELVEQADEKAIVFCPYVPVVDMVYEYLRDGGVKASRIYGATAPGQRSKIFHEFQNERKLFGPEAIVAHPRTMSHGVTLTAANTIIWYAPTDDLEIYEQANARIARPGQTASRVIVKHITASRVESLVYKKLKSKQKTQDVLLEMFEE